MTFSFGQSEFERIEVNVLRYERAPSGDYFDDNWLITLIRVSAGGFHAKFDAAITTDELAACLTELRALYKTLQGPAEFSTIEGQLNLLLWGDGKGNIELTGEAEERPGRGNRLHFKLQFDQSQLAVSIRELERVMLEFPVRRE